ncbi:UNVERIFIED_CONTAM: hypothetical protein BEN50_08060 [Euhalothece sp. KZN 001]
MVILSSRRRDRFIGFDLAPLPPSLGEIYRPPYPQVWGKFIVPLTPKFGGNLSSPLPPSLGE